MAADATTTETPSLTGGVGRTTARRFLLVGGATYFVWWFAVQALVPGSYNPLASRLLVVGYFLLAFVWSFGRGVKRRAIDRAFAAGAWLLTGHYFYLIHRNAGAMPWAIGGYVVVIAVGACLRSRASQLAYSLLSLTLSVLVALFNPVLLQSIFLPGLATMLILSNFGWHTRSLLEAERAERLIADARRTAAEANVVAREEFIAVASHELYTPLTALQLTIQSLSGKLSAQEGPLPRETVIERLDRCGRHVTRLIRLVDELLNTSRIGSGTPSLHPEDVRLVELVHEVATIVGSGPFEATLIEVSGDATIMVRCDRLRIEQVVTNLLRNALKFGPGKTVQVAVARVDDKVRLTVADQGIGIAAADQVRIFGAFERAVSITHYGGMGLGLHIAKQIVEAHGGSIGVESEIGHGAKFIVELPAPEGVAPARPSSGGVDA